MSKRIGLIARKLGMTQVFGPKGKAFPVTVLYAQGNTVIKTKQQAKDGYTAVVLGFERAKESRVNKPQLGIYRKAGITPCKFVKEFRVPEEAFIEVGKEIGVDHFVAGQYVDIHGINIGKGFAGPMKRWNFRGLEASHGVSVSHRSHGSTGQRQDPGKTFKNKKMAGHMGTELVTIQNLKVIMIDIELGVIAVYGSVPGKKNSIITITDAVKKPTSYDIPYPAKFKEKEENVG